MTQPSLFGGSIAPAGRPAARPAHPLAPWFEAIAGVIGRTAAVSSAGRVLKIAKAMKLAGLHPSTVPRIVDVVARYAAWRKTVDLSAVQECWPWLIEPPKTVGGGELVRAVEAFRDDAEPPF